MLRSVGVSVIFDDQSIQISSISHALERATCEWVTVGGHHFRYLHGCFRVSPYNYQVEVSAVNFDIYTVHVPAIVQLRLPLSAVHHLPCCPSKLRRAEKSQKCNMPESRRRVQPRVRCSAGISTSSMKPFLKWFCPLVQLFSRTAK